ncbi:porin family protein [Thiovibrio frasassiensis]|uniref:Tetratricopeptide repeat protein n=1 Tax=Thiovibrio frasassiensis TaxID=2984131 RepID=A0A9X4MLA8_9BACT|nr:porin family protein [Thiovibrio frasassiensis]MDG4476914.1 tetratricopeptide repeat protein [Thiovibrio frasassiensis]
MTQFNFIAVILIALHLFLGQAVAAEGTSTPFSLGKQYVDQGRFEEAYSELHKAFRLDPGNPELNFLLGRAAFETGRYEEAVMAYERVLIADPEASRVKLELARTHLKLGTRELAKQYFKEVLATNPPQQVWKNIEKFLASIEASERKHFVNGTFTFGHAWDSNARSAPVSSQISAGLFEFQLTGASATPESDQINNTTLVLNHVYKNEEYPFLWKTAATSYNALYQSLHDLDVNYLGLATGPVFQKDNYIWDIQALGSGVDVEHDRYQSAYGASSSLTVFFSEKMMGAFAAKAEEKNNYVDPERDAVNLLISAGPILLIGDNRLSLLFSKERESAENKVNSYDRFGWKLRYDHPLPNDFAAFAGLGYTSTDYDTRHPFFFTYRRDDVQELNGGVSRLLWQDKASSQALIMQLGHTYTYSESNIGLYTYRKNVTELSLTVSF